MSRTALILPILFGVLGTAVLTGFAFWQLARSDWKEGLIDELEARITAAPVVLPDQPDPEADEFRRVTITGRFPATTGTHGFADAPLLTSQRPYGAGYRIIQPFETEDGRRIMVDRGFLPADQKNDGGAASLPTPAPLETVTLIGALRWPDEANAEPFGARDNVWIDRDLDVMATLFDTEPLLIVAETSTNPDGARWPIPAPLTVDLPNNHLQYVITWAGLALVWAVMSIIWIRGRLRAARSIAAATD